MQNLHGKDAVCLATFRAEVLELRKYAVLNSTAAIKAVKKRNRHLRASLGSSGQAIRATDLLSQQHFFTSTKLAALSTQAEILAQVRVIFLTDDGPHEWDLNLLRHAHRDLQCSGTNGWLASICQCSALLSAALQEWGH